MNELIDWLIDWLIDRQVPQSDEPADPGSADR